MRERERNELARDGLTLIPGFFTGEEIAALRTVVDTLLTSDVPRSRQVLYTHESAPSGRPHFDTLMYQWLNPHLLPGAGSTRAVTRAARLRVRELLGAEPVLFQDLLLLKQAGHPRFPWHQDFPFWPVDRPAGVIIWTPLIAADEHTGGLAFARASHRLAGYRSFAPATHGDRVGTAFWPAVDLHTGLLQGDDSLTPDRALAACDVVRPQFHAGDAAVFDPLLFHMSPAKSAGPTRAAWSSIWLHPSVRWQHARAPRHPLCRRIPDGELVTEAAVIGNAVGATP